MKKNNKPSLSIGIPAYNEGENIEFLLSSIVSQTAKNYTLKQILVVSDGSTDDTVTKALKFSKIYPIVKVISSNHRTGKANALNKIHAKSDTDYLLTIDADLIFQNKRAIDNLIAEMEKSPHLMLCGPRHIAVKPSKLFGLFSYISYLSLEDAFLKLNSGNNFYAMMGAGMIRKQIYKRLIYPVGTQSDQCYLYAFSTKDDFNAFKLVRSSKVLFRVVETFEDWRILGIRSVIGDKKDLVYRFGPDVLKRYSMSRIQILSSMIKYFFISPIGMTGSILMNLYIRLFPFKKATPKNGIWQTTRSNKIAIKV